MGTELLERLSSFDPRSSDNNDLKKRIHSFRGILNDLRDWIPQAYENSEARHVLVSLTPILGLHMSSILEDLIASAKHINPNEEPIAKLTGVHPPSSTMSVDVFASFHSSIRERTEQLDNLIVGKSSESCFIATAACESPDAQDVLILRQFRDSHLQRTSLGRRFITAYLILAPRLAMLVKRSRAARLITRYLIVKPCGWGAKLLVQSFERERREVERHPVRLNGESGKNHEYHSVFEALAFSATA